MDENGNLIYADLNGDGLINVDDKVSSDPYTYFVNYKDLPENSLTKTHYMTEIKRKKSMCLKWKHYGNNHLRHSLFKAKHGIQPVI